MDLINDNVVNNRSTYGLLLLPSNTVIVNWRFFQRPSPIRHWSYGLCILMYYYTGASHTYITCQSLTVRLFALHYVFCSMTVSSHSSYTYFGYTYYEKVSLVLSIIWYIVIDHIITYFYENYILEIIVKTLIWWTNRLLFKTINRYN